MVDFQDAGFKAGIGNYKGLMLCNRPNEEIRIIVEKPFISRVDPKIPLGWNPVKTPELNKPEKRIKYVLKRHQDWLNTFKKKVQQKRVLSDTLTRIQQDKIDKLREQSLRKIEKRKSSTQKDWRAGFDNDTQQNNEEYLNQQQNQGDLSADKVAKILNEDNDKYKNNQEQYNDNFSQQNLKNSQLSTKNKKNKPQWAISKKEYEEKKKEQQDNKEKEVDDLLDFVNNLDYENYIKDLEIQTMIGMLKTKIEDLNKDPEKMREQQLQLQNNQSRKDIFANNNNNNDIQDNKSTHSHQSKQSIKSIKEDFQKKNKQNEEKPDWEKSTTYKEDNKLTIQNKLVRHIADEIIKSNKYIRGIHSNTSLRKILEKEAQAHIQQTGLLNKLQNNQIEQN